MNAWRSLIGGLLISATITSAQVPQLINYQGRVTIGGTNVTGNYNFRFALVDGTGATTYWSNGTAAVSLSVNKGLYSVLLGDTSVPNMAALPASVFTNSDVRLRVWFDGGSGLQQLSPDQRISAVGYALMSANVPDGTITSYHIAPGSISDAHISPTAEISDTKLATIATPGKVADSALSANVTKLGNTIEGSEIKDGTITTDDIASISASKIAGGDLAAERLKVGINHTLEGYCSTIAGGDFNRVTNRYCTVSGGYGNSADGYAATVSGGYAGHSRGDYASVGGGMQNNADAENATVAGGRNNSANGWASTISGGELNSASDAFAFVGGGTYNAASHYAATVVGGTWNVASNSHASVLGGSYNVAGGQYSLAAGRKACALHDGSFVWADNHTAPFQTATTNQFLIRASGGVGINTNAPVNGMWVNGQVWAWGFFTPSNPLYKRDITPANPTKILEQVASLQIFEWSYAHDPSTRHIGPMAPEFHDTFRFGYRNDGIPLADLVNISLAAIKGLNGKLEEVVKEKDARIAALEQEIRQLKTLQQRLERLESRFTGGQQ